MKLKTLKIVTSILTAIAISPWNVLAAGINIGDTAYIQTQGPWYARVGIDQLTNDRAKISVEAYCVYSGFFRREFSCMDTSLTSPQYRIGSSYWVSKYQLTTSPTDSNPGATPVGPDEGVPGQLDKLAAAGKEPGARVTSSGLVIRMLREGTGASPNAASTVRVNYKGYLTNGVEFDSSYKRGAPLEFGLGRVIPCWTEGVSMMRVGGAAKLTCPASTAYGSRSAGSQIPPNSVLVFEIELLAAN